MSTKQDNKINYDARVRNHNALLYPDCEEHVKALELMLADNDLKLSCILHNLDEWTDEDEEKNPEHIAGELKKSHWHIVIEHSKACQRSVLAKKYGVNKECFEPCINLKKSKRYLMHLDNPEKTLYEIFEVFGNNRNSVVELVTGKPDENLSAGSVSRFIDNFDGYLSISALNQFCYENGLWRIYRQSQYIFNSLRIEHNEACSRAENERLKKRKIFENDIDYVELK